MMDLTYTSNKLKVIGETLFDNTCMAEMKESTHNAMKHVRSKVYGAFDEEELRRLGKAGVRISVKDSHSGKDHIFIITLLNKGKEETRVVTVI